MTTNRGYTIVETAKILKLGTTRIRTLVKEGVLKKNLFNRIDDNSVSLYYAELQERRKVSKAVWVYRNEF